MAELSSWNLDRESKIPGGNPALWCRFPDYPGIYATCQELTRVQPSAEGGAAFQATIRVEMPALLFIPWLETPAVQH